MDKQAKDDASSKQAQMNAVWQRIASRADEQIKHDTEMRARRNATADAKKKRTMQKWQKILIIALAIIIVLIIGLIIWRFFARSSTDNDPAEPTYNELADKAVNATTDKGVEEMLELDNEGDYSDICNVVIAINPKAWTDQQVEQVRYCVAYYYRAQIAPDALSLGNLAKYGNDNGKNIYNDEFTEEFVNKVIEWAGNQMMETSGNE